MTVSKRKLKRFGLGIERTKGKTMTKEKLKAAKRKCVVCGGLITMKQLAKMRIENLSGKEPVCTKHIEEIINYLNKLKKLKS